MRCLKNGYGRSAIVMLLLWAAGAFGRDKIIVFHAGSLAVPFAAMEKAFEKKFPDFDVVRESAGSRECARKITEIGKKADVMASADFAVIDNLMIPDYAKFNARFAVNEMVLAYTDKSRFASGINSTNWPDVLLRDGVKSGHSNPNLDPCGYRAVLTVKLAEKFYGRAGFYQRLMGYGESYENGEENRKRMAVRPKETDLLALLELGAIDYLFIYRSVASQHGLKFVELPDQINLGNSTFSEVYKKASFRISGKKPGEFITKHGAPMVYGITVVEHGKKLPANRGGAMVFVHFVLCDEGQKIMRENGQPPIVPALVSGDDSILAVKGPPEK